jgi:hypothetical protein
MSNELIVSVPDGLIEQANAIVVSDAASEKAAADIFASCDRTLKEIEARRKEKVAPLNEIVKEINATAKRLSEPFASAKDTVGRRISEWRSSEAIREAEELRRSAAHNAAKLAEMGELEKAQGMAECANDLSAIVPKTVATEDGSLRFRTVIVIDSIDMAALPERYVIRTADEKLIKQDLSKGNASVPGVVWREVRTPINYR